MIWWSLIYTEDLLNTALYWFYPNIFISLVSESFKLLGCLLAVTIAIVLKLLRWSSIFFLKLADFSVSLKIKLVLIIHKLYRQKLGGKVRCLLSVLLD